MTRRLVSSGSRFEEQIGYSRAVVDGDWVFVAGMTGLKPGTQEIVEGGITAQTRQTMENIRTAFAAGGASMLNIT